MNILLLGNQGSGKGTQAKLLVARNGFTHFEMGKVLRDAAENDEELNDLVNNKGAWVPDEVSSKIAVKHLEETIPNADNILFDGFPRSEIQLGFLENWLKTKNKKLDKVIFLTLSEEESIRRLSARRTHIKTGEIYNMITKPPVGIPDEELFQRKDDEPEAIKERLTWSNDLMKPLLNIFGDREILIEMNGEQSIEEIYEEIVRKLGL